MQTKTEQKIIDKLARNGEMVVAETKTEANAIRKLAAKGIINIKEYSELVPMTVGRGSNRTTQRKPVQFVEARVKVEA